MDRTGKDAIQELLSPGELLATESKQDTIIAAVRPLQGDGSSGQVDLVDANTWHQVPPSGSVPSNDYVLVVTKESISGVLRWSFDNDSAPSATYGNRLLANEIIVELNGGDVIYFGSSNAGDDVNWTAKEI